MEQTYLYSVHPKRPITDLSGVGFLRVPKSLQLTKEDVKKCLEKAVVYRRFANEGGKEVRVTINDIDRLHNAKYMTEEEYKEFLANGLSEGAGKVVVEEAPVEEEEEEPVKVKDESIGEEKPEEDQNDLDAEEIFESDDEEDAIKSVEPEAEEAEPVEENQTVDTASEVSGEEAVEEVVEETAAEKVEEGNDEKESTVEEVVDEKVEEKSSKHHHKK
jgi:hypothetical protein